MGPNLLVSNQFCRNIRAPDACSGFVASVCFAQWVFSFSSTSKLYKNMAEFKENRLNSAWGRFQLTSAVQSPAGPNSSCSACRVDQPIDSLIVKIVLLVFFMSVFFQGEAMQAVFAEGIGTKLDRDSTET